MKRAIRRLLVPNYSPQRHSFLLGRWWFRLFIVCYLPFILLLGALRWISEVEDVYDACVERAKVIEGNGTPAFYEQLGTCNKLARDAWTYPGILQTAAVPPILLHYLGQLLLFRVVVDFVALGGRSRHAESGNT